MLRYLFLLFVLLPLGDMLLLLKIADVIGIVETILLVVLTGIIGASLIQEEGFDVLQRLQNAVYLEEASQTLIEGALLVAGGIFLLSPGIITDLLGFSLVFSRTRQVLAAKLRQRLKESGRFNVTIRHM